MLPVVEALNNASLVHVVPTPRHVVLLVVQAQMSVQAVQLAVQPARSVAPLVAVEAQLAQPVAQAASAVQVAKQMWVVRVARQDKSVAHLVVRLDKVVPVDSVAQVAKQTWVVSVVMQGKSVVLLAVPQEWLVLLEHAAVPPKHVARHAVHQTELARQIQATPAANCAAQAPKSIAVEVVSMPTKYVVQPVVEEANLVKQIQTTPAAKFVAQVLWSIAAGLVWIPKQTHRIVIPVTTHAAGEPQIA
jgi:hypothetical protein